MIVVAHPDDELLGLGASMYRLVQNYSVLTHVVILGEGITSRSEKRDVKAWENELRIHRANVYNAQKAIGYHSVNVYEFPDNRFDSVALLDIIKTVEQEVEKFRPDYIFTHHGGDVNVDHQRTFQAVITACRPMEHSQVKGIICFETPSGTEWRSSADPFHFIPNLFISFQEDALEAKLAAMECYEFERRNYPHPRSPQALRIQAQRWGVAVGRPFAEAFTIIRSIC